jgi:hypothetical protein
MTEFVSPIGSPVQDLVFHLPPEQRKQNYNILLLEGIDQLAVDRLKDEGYMVESLKATLDPQELKEKIKTVHAIGIRCVLNSCKMHKLIRNNLHFELIEAALI